ncbi:hypothetical protein BDL97_02G162400 [Sphagnum fallax]|nr:hypothetical protein BDL97_02G162400 [Sphagnum fallax]
MQSIPGPHSHRNLKKPTVVCRIQITGFHKSARMICGSGTCQTYVFSGFIERLFGFNLFITYFLSSCMCVCLCHHRKYLANAIDMITR